MLQNTGNGRSEDQEDSGRDFNEEERSHYEGFGGMNYEQRRQPYDPQKINDRNRQREGKGNENRRNRDQ